MALAFLPLTSQARVEEELKRLNKCYALFVRERIPNNDPLWKQVSEGKKSGTDACMEIFDKGKLNSQGELSKGPDGQYDYEGMRVLNSFMRFHKSQFEIPDYSQPLGTGNDRFTRDVTDSNDPSYQFLYSLFAPNQPFSKVVTRDFSIRAIRYSAKSDRSRSVTGAAIPSHTQGSYKTIKDELGKSITVPNDAAGGITSFIPTFVETGILVGLEADRRDNTLSATHFNSVYGSYKFTSTDVNQHLGGGAMGTQAYLLGNMGKDGFTSGGTNLFRRWGKHVMQDFLCRDLPALRSRDVVSEVDPESKIAFKTGISCMGCHSSMDPLAGTIRNMRAAWSHNTSQVTGRIKFIGERTPDMGFAPFPSISADSNFHRRPANGRLYYRSYDGSIVKEEVLGLEDLGQKMAATNDLYVCAAKRYYKFLTGIDVNLADIGDINTPQFSEGENFQRTRIIDWGLELKKHQSLRTLIKKIIESNAFIYPDRGV